MGVKEGNGQGGQVVEKILSFPVTVSVPLTTFDDVKMMYEEFSNVEKTIDAKIAEFY